MIAAEARPARVAATWILQRRYNEITVTTSIAARPFSASGPQPEAGEKMAQDDLGRYNI